MSEEAVKLASYPTTKTFQIIYFYISCGDREDLKTRLLLGNVEKLIVKIIKYEAIFFILSLESNLCSELLLNLHPIFLPRATSYFT